MDNKTSVQIGDNVYRADGKYLICTNLRTGKRCFSKSFNHPEYETLRDLGIREVQASPDSQDIILLFESPQRGYKTVGNLARVTTAGEVIWWAELTDTGTDDYVAVSIDAGRILAWSWNGYRCEIDPRTGRILSRAFTK
jgi:16S rRNA C1402 (ribose-2'-O) methylase RsmI